uniref:BZIP domain-containing protein n=1 Tax=Nelumbo nucifera TaxID=4432 RepID=A0A822ZT25_NELNU|nr:TPA_asm: hypothetical protein HUJ06_017607 [Nelumbo nucifera]
MAEVNKPLGSPRSLMLNQKCSATSIFPSWFRNMQEFSSDHHQPASDSSVVSRKPETLNSGTSNAFRFIEESSRNCTGIDPEPFLGQITTRQLIPVDNTKVTSESSLPTSSKNSSVVNDLAASSGSKTERIGPSSGRKRILIDLNLDPRKMRQILANRQYAERLRMRKRKYVAELEKTRNLLEAEISVLCHQVSQFEHQIWRLRVENNSMKQKIANLMGVKMLLNSQFDARTVERERLRRLLELKQE